jgi:hypothetical protein
MPTVPTRRPFDPTRLTKLNNNNNRPTGTSNSRAGVFNNDNNRVIIKPDVALNVPNGPVYLSPQDNEIADSSNVKNNVPPNVNEPQNTIESDSQGFTPKLNLGKYTLKRENTELKNDFIQILFFYIRGHNCAWSLWRFCLPIGHHNDFRHRSPPVSH